MFDGERCDRDRGLAIGWLTAAKACRVVTLRGLLNLDPTERVARMVEARERLRGRPVELAGRP